MNERSSERSSRVAREADLFLNILHRTIKFNDASRELRSKIKEQKNKLEFEIKKSQIEFNRKFKIYDKVYLYDENCWKNGEF